MANSQITLYYKNATSDVIGRKHGIITRQLSSLEKKTKPLIAQINKQRKAGQTPYRDLPYDKRISRRVNTVAKALARKCDYLVVLGIGGSALGNIAVDTALRPFLPSPKEKRSGKPQLFVFDNVDPAQFGSFLDYIEPKLAGLFLT